MRLAAQYLSFAILIYEDKIFDVGAPLGISYPIVNIIFQTIRTRMMAVTENETQPQATSPLVSYHVFLFPFRWDFIAAGQAIADRPFSERADRKQFGEMLHPNWGPFKEQEDSAIEFYNDAMFFYDSTRESIFGNLKQQGHNSSQDSVVTNYTFKCEEPLKYKIWTKNFGVLNLNLDKIRLNVYAPGIGILAFHLSNDKESDPEKILRINDFGRRLFPAFLTVDENKSLLETPQEVFLPTKIEIVTSSGNFIFEEDFKEFAIIRDRIKDKPDVLPNGSQKLLTSILGKNFTLESHRNLKADQIIIRPSMDDRMFAVCWYGNGVESEILKWDKKASQYGFQDFEKSAFWLRFLFMEHGEGSAQSRLMRRSLADKHTYHRWADVGTFYGVTRTTFVCLTNEEEFPRKYISHDMRRLYMEMAQIVLAQHAATIRFSDEVAILRKGQDSELLNSRDVRFLHRKYLEFVNHIYFRSITPSEQGQELYTQLQAGLDIEPAIYKLDQEVEEFNQLVNRLEAQKRERLNALYASIGAFVIPATLIAAILGMETLGDNFAFYGGTWNAKFLFSLMILFIISLLARFGFNWWIKRKNLK